MFKLISVILNMYSLWYKGDPVVEMFSKMLTDRFEDHGNHDWWLVVESDKQMNPTTGAGLYQR